ncbi:MAG TPA: methyltransferase domain-containing protein [Bacteroides sp.]|nr:methyltransferase domain-containing protein [Bacteroides sp.]
MNKQFFLFGVLSLIMFVFPVFPGCAQSPDAEIDRRVQEFLNSPGRGYANVPTSDGKLLHEIILKNNYKSALEIGTSTGVSGIWIALALSKTGGKLITIDIDETRHKQALENFERAGLSDYIDARLADAHELVPALEGPFDFIFSDADKYWYQNYFEAVDPKLVVKGCYTTHNVSDQGGGQNSGYLNFLKQLPNYETTVNNNGSGMAISYKKSEK